MPYRSMKSLLVLLPCMASTSMAADSAPLGFTLQNDIVHSEHPVKVTLGAEGYYRLLPPPNGFADPIEVPADSADKSAAKDAEAKRMKAFTDAFVDRIETNYLPKVGASADFLTWLKAHPDIRRDFWLALSPQFDDAKAAVLVLDTLRQHNTKTVEKYAQLAIAVAVVHDTPDALVTSRLNYLWAVSDKQFSPQRAYVEVFDYFTSPKVLPKLAFPPDQLPWPILVHLVDFDVADSEIDWAWKNCVESRKDLGALYQTVPYDYDKLGGRTPKLGSSDYTLENLRAKGGVCVDQAHYTSRVSKCFGVPSMKVAGEGRYGASSLHAWAGFLINAGGRPQLEFTGRYQFDFYYTGDIFDPQTRTVILDREVAMLYDGISLSFPKYQDSSVLSRAALRLINDDAPRAMMLARQAIDRDTFNPTAWRLLAYGVSIGAIEKKEGNILVARLMKDLAAHPDLTLECLKRFMAAIPDKEFDARQKIFAKAYTLYDKRPDLQIRMRLQQCEELIAAKHEVDALQTALQTCTVNAKEGSLILPLVAYVVEASKAFATTNPKFQVGVVKQALVKIEKDFPQKRGDTVSAAYLELKKLMESL